MDALSSRVARTQSHDFFINKQCQGEVHSPATASSTVQIDVCCICSHDGRNCHVLSCGAISSCATEVLAAPCLCRCVDFCLVLWSAGNKVSGCRYTAPQICLNCVYAPSGQQSLRCLCTKALQWARFDAARFTTGSQLSRNFRHTYVDALEYREGALVKVPLPRLHPPPRAGAMAMAVGVMS